MIRGVGVALVLLFALAVSRTAVAHEGHEHTVMGTVTMAAADHVMLKDKAGKDLVVYLKKDTKVVQSKAPMTVTDIKTNMRVVIKAVTTKEKGTERMVANSIELATSLAK